MRSEPWLYHEPDFWIEPELDAEVDDLAFARDALAVEDLELGLLERRRDLVLHDLDARLVAR